MTLWVGAISWDYAAQRIRSIHARAIGGIDQLFVKAGTVLGEARNHLARYDCDLTVRRPQEAFELYLKTLFRFLQREYPASHDLKKHVYELAEVLKEY